MSPRLLLAAAGVIAVSMLDACKGIDVNDPRVRECHDDTVLVPITGNDGRVIGTGRFIFRDPARPDRCRMPATT